MAFTYKKLADYLLDGLAGKQSINQVKNNIRYLAEDLLGDPFSNSHEANFNLGNFTIASPREIKGDRQILTFGHQIALASGDFYIGCADPPGTLSHAVGYQMHRPGSIIGGTILFSTDTHSGNPLDFATAVPKIRVNAVDKLLLSEFSITGSGIVKSTAKQARNISTFVAGDVLSIFIDYSLIGAANVDIVADVEIVYDT